MLDSKSYLNRSNIGQIDQIGLRGFRADRNDHTAKPPRWRGWISLDLAYLYPPNPTKTNLPL